MNRAIWYYIGLLFILASCTQRMVCPAYQSAYIYDKDELRKRFSYFENDSTPKVYTASKTKYLIAEPTNYRKKTRTMQSVAAKKVMVNVPDSISGKGSQDSVITADLDKAARSVIDSTVIVSDPMEDTVATSDEDSTYVITKDREVRVLKYNAPDSLEYDSVNHKYVAQKPKYYVDEVGFNTEQDSYMWYLRHSLVLPDVRLAKMQTADKTEGKDSKKKGAKKGPFAFFKNLFGKKEKVDIDSAELDIKVDPDTQFDYIDTTATEAPQQRVQQSAPRKKGLLGNKNDDSSPDDQPAIDEPKKRKKKNKKADQPVKPKEEKKKEDEDDGF